MEYEVHSFTATELLTIDHLNTDGWRTFAMKTASPMAKIQESLL